MSTGGDYFMVPYSFACNAIEYISTLSYIIKATAVSIMQSLNLHGSIQRAF